MGSICAPSANLSLAATRMFNAACLTRRTEKPTSTDSKCFCAVAVRKAFDYVTLAIMALREISGCIEALGEMLARRAVHPESCRLRCCTFLRCTVSSATLSLPSGAKPVPPSS
jgi:hypothetical protein